MSGAPITPRLSDQPAERVNAAQRRYLWRFLPTMATYVVVLFAVDWLFDHTAPEGVLKYALAALPALPLIAVVVILGAYLLEETDEFLRMRQALALLIGFGVTLSATTLWGFLETFAQAPHFETFLIFPAFCVAYGLATAVLEWVCR